MLKLHSQGLTFTHPVKVYVPSDGGHVEQEFKATFRVVDTDKISSVDTLESETDLLKEIVVGLDDIVGDDGEKLPFSNELRDKLIALPFVHRPLLTAYLAAVTKVRPAS